MGITVEQFSNAFNQMVDNVTIESRYHSNQLIELYVPKSPALIINKIENVIDIKGKYFSEDAENDIAYTFETVDAISQLKNNWDGYGAVPPSHSVVDNTKNFITSLPKVIINLLIEDNITPTPYGTIVLDIKKLESLISVEIGDEMIGYFTEFADNDNPSNEFSIKDDKNYSELFSLFKRVIS